MSRHGRPGDFEPADDLVTLHLFAADYPRLRSWGLARWCLDRGADEWAVEVVAVKGAPSDPAERLEAAMVPFRRPSARRRHLSAPTEDQLVRPTELWHLTSASLAALHEFFTDGLFSYDPADDGWLEDPTLYRGGVLMLGVVTHEGEGVLRVTAAERAELGRGGFPFRVWGKYVGY